MQNNQKDYIKDSGLKFAMLFSWFWSVFSALYILLATFVTLPVANARVVDQVLGFIMGTIVATIINFWVGSSLGSKQANQDLKQKDDSKEGSLVSNPVDSEISISTEQRS